MKTLNDKKHIFLIGFFLLTSFSYAQTGPVEDSYTRYQEERRVWKRWDSNWKPAWVYGKGPIGEVGSFLFPKGKKYRTEGGDKRNTLQLTPTIAFSEETRKHSSKTDTLVGERAWIEEKKLVDRTANLSYEVEAFGGYKKKFQALENQFYAELTNTVDCNGVAECQDEKLQVDLEYTMLMESLKDDIKLVRKSFDNDAKKSEFYGEQLDIMRIVVSKYVAKKQKMRNIYKYGNLLDF